MGDRETGEGGKGEGGKGDALDSLYQIPLSEFTPGRNALVSRLKKTGRQEEAEQVKALVKPSVPAWVVNQLFWHHRPAFDDLMSIGQTFRTAQAAQLAGRSADLRGPIEQRREALSALARVATTILRDAGHNPTPDALRRITSTLEALSVIGSSRGSSPEAPRAGRLVDDVDPPGFETLAALVPRVDGEDEPGGAPSRVLAFRRQKPAPKASAGRTESRKTESVDERQRREREERATELESARAAVQGAERALRAARRAAGQAQVALKKAAQRARETERARLDAEHRLEKTSAASEAARQQARKAAVPAEEAAQAVSDAERALEKARSELRTRT